LKKETKLHDPLFSVDIYLILMSSIMILSFVAFLIIWFFRDKFQKNFQTEQKTLEQQIVERSLLNTNEELVIDEPPKTTTTTDPTNKDSKLTKKSYIYLSIVLWTSILLIGCIPSINSYSLNPYGSKTFHYVIILTQCCYPLVSLIANLRPKLFDLSLKSIYALTFIGSLVFVYIFVTALKSPCSPFVDETIGSLLIALMWILIYLIFYTVRVSLGNYFNDKVGHRGLFWYGLLTQAGAFTGALFIFTLNSAGVFHEKDFCDENQCRAI